MFGFRTLTVLAFENIQLQDCPVPIIKNVSESQAEDLTQLGGQSQRRAEARNFPLSDKAREKAEAELANINNSLCELRKTGDKVIRILIMAYMPSPFQWTDLSKKGQLVKGQFCTCNLELNKNLEHKIIDIKQQIFTKDLPKIYQRFTK